MLSITFHDLWGIDVHQVVGIPAGMLLVAKFPGPLTPGQPCPRRSSHVISEVVLVLGNATAYAPDIDVLTLAKLVAGTAVTTSR